MQLLIIVPLVLLPILTVSHVFSSWLIITILLVAYLMGRESWGKHFHFCVQFESLREIIKYASGRLVADFFQFSLAAFPLIYISNMQGLQTTAYFSVGIFFVTMITPLFSFMGIILLPYVSQAIAKDEMKSANRLIQRLLLIYIGGALFFIAVLYLFTDFLTILLFNSDYVVTSDLTRIMVLSILPQAVYILYRNTIDAASIIPYNAIILGISLITMVVSFTLSSSITHYAWAYLAVSTLQGLLACLVWRFLRMK